MSIMDHEFSDELSGLMPVVPHGISGVDCSGCIVAVVEDSNVELRWDKCGDVVGVVQVNIMEGLLGLDCAEATCPQCGKVNTFSSFSEISTFVCDQCGNRRSCGRNGARRLTRTGVAGTGSKARSRLRSCAVLRAATRRR